MIEPISLDTCFSRISHRLWESFEETLHEEARLSSEDNRASEKRQQERIRARRLAQFALEAATRV